MTQPKPGPACPAVEHVVAGFAHSLFAQDLAPRVARLETRMRWPGSSDALFAAETAMAAVWRRARILPPAHELVWHLDAAPPPPDAWIKIQALDAQGRVLLSRCWSPTPEGNDAPAAEGGARG